MVALAGIGAVFGLAAAGKVASFQYFVGTIHGLGLSDSTARAAAIAVIGLEEAVFLLYATSLAPAFAAAAALALCAVFAGAGLRARLGHLSVPCSCFGAGSADLGLSTVARASLLAMAVVVGFMMSLQVTHLRADVTAPVSLTLLAAFAGYRLFVTMATEARK